MGFSYEQMRANREKSKRRWRFFNVVCLMASIGLADYMTNASFFFEAIAVWALIWHLLKG